MVKTSINLIIYEWNLDTDLERTMEAMIFFLKNNDSSVISYFSRVEDFFKYNDKILW
jgi:hypothetical protein